LVVFNHFWHATLGKNVTQMTINFGHLTLILLLQYLEKCRSRSLAFYNNNFILDSACIGSELINWKSDKHDWQLLYLKKSHMTHHILFITACAQNVFLQHECKRETLTPLANSRLYNLHFTR